MKYLPILLVILFAFSIPSISATVIIEDADFNFDEFGLNVTNTITVESFSKNNDNFTTRFHANDDLYTYTFDNSTTGLFNAHWNDIDSEHINFTISTVESDIRGTAEGSEFALVELDQVSVVWSYTGGVNIIDIDESDLIEYFFVQAVPPETFNAIILSLNSPTTQRLGGVYALTCPANSTITALLTNGTFICTSMDTFFP